MKPHTGLAIACTVLAAACGTPGPNQTLELARTHYNDAASSPQVVQAAPIELTQARESLASADAAWKHGAAQAEVDHLAYMANQRALIAIERGRLAEAEKIIKNASTERNQAVLEARNRGLEARAETAEQSAAAQAQRAADLQRALSDLAAKQTSIGMVMTLDDVLFDVGKATLKPGAQRSLDRLAQFMKSYPERKVRIEGFTDATGSVETNQALSSERAKAVRDELLRLGIPGDRIEVAGYGPAFPVASNKTAAGRQQNRRVEIVISDESGNVSKR